VTVSDHLPKAGDERRYLTVRLPGQLTIAAVRLTFRSTGLWFDAGRGGKHSVARTPWAAYRGLREWERDAEANPGKYCMEA
jgi:hypothetical protein